MNCPINLDESPDLCSAGTCTECQFRRWYSKTEMNMSEAGFEKDDIARSAFYAGRECDNPIDVLTSRVISLYERKDWPLGWADRLSYLILESSEFVEAVRGKGGDPVDEAGDILITVLALIEPNDITFDDMMKAANKKINDLIKEERDNEKD